VRSAGQVIHLTWVFRRVDSSGDVYSSDIPHAAARLRCAGFTVIEVFMALAIMGVTGNS
jgi:prepilin-type N-terminal cleavage/methylation domain-containing protein